MNKIIIVGHPQSGHEEVQRLLTECGMASAHPSRRDNLTPAQVSQILLKAHGAVPVDQLQTAQQLQQIRVAPVWQGMVVDLMLANLDQALWGWADTDAVYLLDYWKEQDPQVVFVLVYDTPETVLTRAPLDQAAASEEELQRRIDAWVAYNAALLHFHLRNLGCSVLVHASQVQASARKTLQHISAHITAPLQLPIGLQASEASHVRAEQSGQTDTIESLTAQLQTMQGSQFKKARKRLRTQLEALQAASEARAAQALEVPAPNHGATAAAAEMTLCAQSGVLEQDDLSRDALAQLLARQLLQSHPQATQLYEELQAAATLAHGMGAMSGKAVVPVQSRESSLAPYQAWQTLVQQRLHLQQQTHLGKTQAEHIRRLRRQMEEDTNAAQERREELQTQLQQALQTLEELPKIKADLKAAQDKAVALKEVGQENQMLLEQLHKVQEELESRYLKVQQQEKTLAELPKIKADLKAAQEKALQSQQSEAKLKKELQTERSKAQASDLQKENELLLTQLHKVQEELERHFLENSKLKAAHKPQPSAYYGAADRVKQQLSYRLGSTMIRQSRSIGGWLSMPFALRAEAKRFRQDQAARKYQQLPPIAQYRDAHEAERIKQHLSYRLGARLLTNAKTLGGRISLPWCLYAEVKAFRKERQSY